MSQVLIDTNVWIDWLKRGQESTHAPTLTRLLLSNDAALVPPTLAELLYGARREVDRATIEGLATLAHVVPIEDAAWYDAGRLGRALRQRGRTLSLIDCVIAVVARQNRLPLWTLDRDFEPLFAEGWLLPFNPDPPPAAP